MTSSTAATGSPATTPGGRPEPWRRLAELRDRAAAAHAAYRLACDHCALAVTDADADRGVTIDDVRAAELAWVRSWDEVKAEMSRVGEAMRVGLVCLAESDPKALAEVFDRAGLADAAAGLLNLQEEADRLRGEVARLSVQVAEYRRAVDDHRRQLDRLAAEADRLRFAEQTGGSARPKAVSGRGYAGF